MEGRTKVVIDKDYEIYVNGTHGPTAKKEIRVGNFNAREITAFVEDENTRKIRDELKRMSELIYEIHMNATKQDGFLSVDKETSNKTDKIAWEMYSIKTNGIEKTPS